MVEIEKNVRVILGRVVYFFKEKLAGHPEVNPKGVLLSARAGVEIHQDGFPNSAHRGDASVSELIKNSTGIPLENGLPDQTHLRQGLMEEMRPQSANNGFHFRKFRHEAILTHQAWRFEESSAARRRINGRSCH